MPMNSQRLDKFADVLKTFVLDSFGQDSNADPFDIAKEFCSIAGSNALELVDNPMDVENKIAYNDWELEARFWKLFELLVSFNSSDSGTNEISAKFYNSNAIFTKELLEQDKDLYQIWIIISWLQENLNIKERPQHLVTSKWSNSLLSGGLKSFDMDYPLRDNSIEIDTRDKNDDHIFFKYIYQLVLLGKMEEAIEECKISENITLAMILLGMQEYLNPRIDTQLAESTMTQQGVKKYALWRRTVFELSRSPQLDKYERAIYNFISGTLPDETILNDSDWETELLLHLNQILQIQMENYLLKNDKIDKSELIISLPSTASTVQDILNLVSAKHPEESSHPIRVLLGAIICNNLPSMIQSSVEMLLNIVKGIDNSNVLFDESYLLRIVTHLTILLDIVNPGQINSNDKLKLITAYVSILKLYGLYDIIPIYICFLDDNDILDAYSFILCTLEDPVVRAKQLELMNYLRLPKANILRRTVQRVFLETENDYTPTEKLAVIFDIDNIDKYSIQAIEWLYEDNMSLDAMESTIMLARRFLINGKIKSLELLIDRHSMEELINNYKLEKITQDDNTNDIDDDALIKEIKQYENLINDFKRHEAWQDVIHQLNSESNIPSLVEKLQDYTQNTLVLIKNFLVELTQDKFSNDFDVLYEIRALYTPYLIIEMSKGLIEAARLLKIPKFIHEALNFTSLVADEKDSIYLLFQSSGRLKEYLQLIAHTATLVNEND